MFCQVQIDEPEHTTFSPNNSRPAAPMSIRKKRGIIPDGMVQMRLANFRKTFPYLENQFGIRESSTNGGGVALQRDIVSANQKGVSGGRKRRVESEHCGGKRR